MNARDGVGQIALIIEDEALIALATEETLNEEGFNTHIFYSEDQIKNIQNLPISIAIVDLQIGSAILGQEIIKKLRLKNPNLPVVVVTGHSKNNLEANLRGLGGPTTRLTKPTRQEDLIFAIKDVIKRQKKGIFSYAGRRWSDKQILTTPTTVF